MSPPFLAVSCLGPFEAEDGPPDLTFQEIGANDPSFCTMRQMPAGMKERTVPIRTKGADRAGRRPSTVGKGSGRYQPTEPAAYDLRPSRLDQPHLPCRRK